MNIIWMPIATAPRNKTRILVCEEGREGVEMVSWKGGQKKGGWVTEDRLALYSFDMFTHWMPVPNALGADA